MFAKSAKFARLCMERFKTASYPNAWRLVLGAIIVLQPDLLPGRETRLEVIKEVLTFDFTPAIGAAAPAAPVVDVSAGYQIRNPDDSETTVEFGFPIIRGIHRRDGQPGVTVQIDDADQTPTVIGTEAIYGIIRMQARAAIDAALGNPGPLGELTAVVRRARAL